MKLIISGPNDNGEGVYSLVSEEGECLASHFCSNSTFAKGDLADRRPERLAAWRERFGEFEIVELANSGITKAELVARNHAPYEASKVAA